MAIVAIILGHQGIGLLFFVVYLINNLYSLINYWRKEKNINYFIKAVDKSIDSNLANLIIPTALTDTKGNILWNNKIFTTICDADYVIGKNILSVANGLNIEGVAYKKNGFHQRLKIEDNLYDVYIEQISNGDMECLVIYFNDISEFIGVEKTKESIMLIEVDNLTEVLETTEDSNKPLVIAEFERLINAYADEYNAMIKKYDKGEYILSVQDRNIEKEISNKFSILEDISKIDKGNKMELTLSIGVGRGGATPQENQSFAIVAKELALGRGGDQAIIKNKEDIQVFGGNSKEIEKRNRVRARVVAHALKELIFESSNIFIVGHINMDMDCFGSAIGLSNIIKKLGKECNVVLDNNTGAIEPYLSKIKATGKYDNLFITGDTAEKNLKEDTLIIIVDVHNKNYVSNLSLIEKANKKVIIDHHRRSPNILEGTLLNYIEVYASSTSEMITEIIQYMINKPKLSKIEAEGLLAGIYMDTKGFSFKTGVRTFDAASFLKKMGAETMEVKKLFTDNLEDYIKISETIKSAKINNSTAIAVAPKDVNSVIVAKSADELLNISGILAAFVLANINEEIYISARSVGDINVQVVLEALGGGGHLNIAGAKIVNKSIDEVLELLNDNIQKYLRVGE